METYLQRAANNEKTHVKKRKQPNLNDHCLVALSFIFYANLPEHHMYIENPIMEYVRNYLSFSVIEDETLRIKVED